MSSRRSPRGEEPEARRDGSVSHSRPAKQLQPSSSPGLQEPSRSVVEGRAVGRALENYVPSRSSLPLTFQSMSWVSRTGQTLLAPSLPRATTGHITLFSFAPHPYEGLKDYPTYRLLSFWRSHNLLFNLKWTEGRRASNHYKILKPCHKVNTHMSQLHVKLAIYNIIFRENSI